MAANCPDCHGGLVIGSTNMKTQAWCVVDLTMLWTGAEQRGTDRLLPNTAGVVAYPRRATVTRHDLPLIIVGSVNTSGVPYADEWEGLAANIDALRSGVVDPTGTGDGTRASTLTMPDGTTRTADIHVERLEHGTPVTGTDAESGVDEVFMRATLAISIPTGAFA